MSHSEDFLSSPRIILVAHHCRISVFFNVLLEGGNQSVHSILLLI